MPGFAGPVLASDLFLLYLAWAMGEARRRIPADLRGAPTPRTTYSVAAPIDQIDGPSELGALYRHVAYCAWRLSGAVKQGLYAGQALAWCARLQSEAPPPLGDQLVELCPESGAIAAGHAMSPDADEGLYAIVDIGAWTTEISVHRFSETSRRETGVPTRAFYAARSHRVGANEIDELCRMHLLRMYQIPLEQVPPGLLRAIRSQREAGTFGRKDLEIHVAKKPQCPRISALRYAQDLCAEKLHRAFADTIGEAYEKEKIPSRWEGQVRVLMAGGGSLDPVLQTGISRHGFVAGTQPIPKPPDIVGLPSAADYRRFLAAYSLAHGSTRWPRDFLPTDVSPIDASLIREHSAGLPTSEELGYEER